MLPDVAAYRAIVMNTAVIPGKLPPPAIPSAASWLACHDGRPGPSLAGRPLWRQALSQYGFLGGSSARRWIAAVRTSQRRQPSEDD
jgi:hypothetical protein